MSWPTGADLAALCQQSGMTLPSGMDTQALVDASIERFVSAVGHGPFLASGVDGSHRLNPPGPRPSANAPWRLGGGTLLRIPSMVAITSVKANHEGGSTGDLLEEWTDYVLEPESARSGRGPFTRVRFVRAMYGPAGSILLTGNEGYTRAVPQEIRQAITEDAGASAAYQLLSTRIVEWKDGDEGERYSIELIGQLWERWRSSLPAAETKFRRMD